MLPTVALLDVTYQVGHRSLADEPNKLCASGVGLFALPGHDLPFVAAARRGWCVA